MEPFAGLCFSSSSKPDAAWEELIGRFGTGLKARVGSVLRRCGVRPRNEHVEEIVQEVYCRLLAGGSRRLRRCRAGDRSSHHRTCFEFQACDECHPPEGYCFEIEAGYCLRMLQLRSIRSEERS